MPDQGQLGWEEPDDSQITQFIEDGRRTFVETISQERSFTNSAQVKSLQGKIKTTAEREGITPLIIQPPTELELTKGLSRLSQMMRNLPNGAATLKNSGRRGREIDIPMDFSVDEGSIKNQLTRDSITNEAEMILKVKRPDYLGNSRWEFRHGSSALEAKITDEEWLDDFRQRGIVLRPGDNLRARVKTITSYGHGGEVLLIYHEIVKVLSIVPPAENDSQLDLNSL